MRDAREREAAHINCVMRAAGPGVAQVVGDPIARPHAQGVLLDDGAARKADVRMAPYRAYLARAARPM